MFNGASLLYTIFFAISAVAIPIALSRDASGPPEMGPGFPMAVNFNVSRLPLPDIDRQRARTLIRNWQAIMDSQHPSKGKVEKRSPSIPVTNQAIQFVVEVGVGSPSTPYTLLVDTSSSNTWVGANKKYVPTSSSKSTGHDINIDYGSGHLKGTECT